MLLRCFMFLAIIVSVCQCIKITKLLVPTQKDFIMDPAPDVFDCQYELEPNETDIVVQWFYNSELIYKWAVPNQPVAFEANHNYKLPFPEGTINTNYTINRNPLKKYRALAFKNSNWTYSGDYSCQVATSSGSDIMRGSHQYFVTPSNFELTDSGHNRNAIIDCRVENIYPLAKLELHRNGEKLDTPEPLKSLSNMGFYTVSLHQSYDGANDGDNYDCILTIPKTTFKISLRATHTIEKTRGHNRGGVSPSFKSSINYLVILLFILTNSFT